MIMYENILISDLSNFIILFYTITRFNKFGHLYSKNARDLYTFSMHYKHVTVNHKCDHMIASRVRDVCYYLLLLSLCLCRIPCGLWY